MKNNKNYCIIKDKCNKKTNNLNNSVISGYELTKNKTKTINGISINNMVIIDNDFIETSINKKVNNKFKKLLELIATICEEDQESGDGLKYALNEIEKFRRIMFNECLAYMNKIQLEKMEKKLNLVENELKMQLFNCTKKYEVEEEIEKSSHRRR